MTVLFFFFSSRRRHTRYWRDWSSDVCSSDLLADRARDQRGGLAVGAEAHVPRWRADWLRGGVHQSSAHQGFARSEERRVGRECRSLRSASQYNKKNNIYCITHLMPSFGIRAL